MGQKHYYIVYKPYGMLSQFTEESPGQLTLAHLSFTFPDDVYPVGRLDRDSEGLLLLTNDKSLNQRLLNPRNKKPKTYLVQVEGVPTPEALKKLEAGIELTINKKTFRTRRAAVSRLSAPPAVPERNPPIRFRKSVPDTWIQITIHEGKNRQVRKMFAAIGYPVLRLIRTNLAGLSVQKLLPGETKPIKLSQLF